MKNIQNKIFVFDVDSTLVKTETLDDIIGIAIDEMFTKRRDILKQKIHEIMNQGMNGEIDFRESLEKRFEVVQVLQKHIDFYNKEILPKYIDYNFKEIIEYIQGKDGVVYVMSAGFIDSIDVVAKKLGVFKKYCFANEFIKKSEKIIGFNKNNPLSQSDGKIIITKKIKNEYPTKEIICIGDGNSDYLIKKEGVANEFWGFWQNVHRKHLAQKANKNFHTSKSLLKFIKD